jgi:hypothetical protein
MTGLVVFAAFVLIVLACLGLFMSGVAALRQARLSKRMFHLRHPSEDRETSFDSESPR